MNFRPINGRIVVIPSEAKEKTSGGIYLPDTAKEKLREGEVVAVAEKAVEDVTVGDHVIYKDFGGVEVKIEGKDCILLVEDDLLAKYEAVDQIPE